jgi:hypothetical protein
MEHRDTKDDEITFDKCVNHKGGYLRVNFRIYYLVIFKFQLVILFLKKQSLNMDFENV